MYINLVGNNLIISFKYTPQAVAAVRMVPGRKFDPTTKNWVVPLDNVVQCMALLEPVGFTPTLEVRTAAGAIAQRNNRAAQLKKDPKGYTGILPLFDYQKIGAGFIANTPGCLLADVPGLGKSVQAIAGVEQYNKVLILCPASLKYNWKNEILKWFPEININLIHGAQDVRKKQWRAAHAKFYIANYEAVLRDWDEIDKHKFEVVICDEAQRISNPASKTAQAVKKIPCLKRVALTGTPVSNKPDDIWSIMDWVRPGLLGHYGYFLKKYSEVDMLGTPTGRYFDLDKLAKEIEPFMLRRKKEDVFDSLPPKIIENIVFDLSPEEIEIYGQIKTRIIDEIREQMTIDTKTLGIIPVKMLRLHQVTNDARLLGMTMKEKSSKLTLLRDMLEPIVASGEKAIVFTQFAEMVKILEAEFPGSLSVYGEVAPEDRQKRVDEFNANPNARIIIMSEAGSAGLNLGKASYIFHYDDPWSIQKLIQREGRAEGLRQLGKTKPLTVYHLIARNTIDEYVSKVLQKKQKMADQILQEGKMKEEDVNEILQTKLF